MMTIEPDFFSAYVVPAGCVLFMAAAALSLIRVHFVLRGSAVEPMDPMLTANLAVREQIAAVCAQCEQIADRQARLADQLADMREGMEAMRQGMEVMSRFERLVVEPTTRTSAMDHAARLARGGASVDELTRNCGLNIGEASLMRRLHGHIGREAGACVGQAQTA